MNDPHLHRARLILLVAIAMGLCSAELSGQCASAPVEKPVAVKVFEIGDVSRRVFNREWQTFWKSYDPTVQLYIINYGSDRQIARREKWITDSISFREFDRARITLVRGGRGEHHKSVVWKVPPGADNPKP
jgi:hypothetical protein